MKRTSVYTPRKSKNPAVKQGSGFALRQVRIRMRRLFMYAKRMMRRRARLLKYGARKSTMLSYYRFGRRLRAVRGVFVSQHGIVQDIRVVPVPRELLPFRTKATFLLIIFLLSNVSGGYNKHTFSFFSDVEAANNNSYGAAVLDIGVDAGEDAAIEISALSMHSRTVTVTNDGLLPFQYDALVTNIQGPAEACDELSVSLSRDGGPSYAAPAGSFHMPATTMPLTGVHDYSMTVLALSGGSGLDPADCMFDMTWRAWQSNVPVYDVSQGYTDDESFENSIHIYHAVSSFSATAGSPGDMQETNVPEEPLITELELFSGTDVLITEEQQTKETTDTVEMPAAGELENQAANQAEEPAEEIVAPTTDEPTTIE